MNHNKAIQKDILQRLYVQEKLSGAEVARRIGASSAAVYNALIRFQIPLRNHRAASQLRWSHTWKTNWSRMARKYESGSTLEDIASEVKCSLATASEHLSKFTEIRPRGVEVKPNSRGRTDIDVKQAIKMNQEGATLTEIGAKLGVSVQIVSKRLQEVGYTVQVHKASKEKFANLQSKKRLVAQAIDASKCVVCPETRGVQLCHIQSRRKGGPLNADNAVALCPSHHWFFDQGTLGKKELAQLRPYLERASALGYRHHHYDVGREA